MNIPLLKIFMLKLTKDDPRFNKREAYNDYWFQRLFDRSTAHHKYLILLEELAADGYLEKVIGDRKFNYVITEKGILFLEDNYSLEELTPYLMTEDPSGTYVKMLRGMDGLPDLDLAF